MDPWKTVTTKFRVWHIPQVPMEPFLVEVGNLREAVRIRDVLSEYDLFQFENRIKPDYCNASGISIPDPDNAGEWIDLEDDEIADWLRD